MSARKRDREAPEVGAMAQRVVKALVRRAAAGDGEALEELLKLAELVPAAVRDAGAAMHRFGYTYTELADIAGITRQGARDRFAEHGSLLARTSSPTIGDLADERVDRTLADADRSDDRWTVTRLDGSTLEA